MNSFERVTIMVEMMSKWGANDDARIVVERKEAEPSANLPKVTAGHWSVTVDQRFRGGTFSRRNCRSPMTVSKKSADEETF